MGNQAPKNAVKLLPDEILILLGPPPLLSTEDPKLYYDVFSHFVKDIDPRDMVTWCFVKDLADYCIEVLRTRRLKADIIQKATEDFLRNMERNLNVSDKERRNGCANRYRKAVEALEKEFADKPEELEAHKVKRSDEYRAGIKDAESIHQEQQSELKALRESGRAITLTLDSWVADVVKVDRLLEEAEKRFYNTLRLIECHLGGFGETIRERGAKILDGEVVSDSSAAPANETGKSSASGKGNNNKRNGRLVEV